MSFAGAIQPCRLVNVSDSADMAWNVSSSALIPWMKSGMWHDCMHRQAVLQSWQGGSSDLLLSWQALGEACKRQLGAVTSVKAGQAFQEYQGYPRKGSSNGECCQGQTPAKLDKVLAQRGKCRGTPGTAFGHARTRQSSPGCCPGCPALGREL